MTTFSTSDFQIAAFAICKGARLLRVDRSSRRAVFIFEGEGTITDYANSFWAGEKVAAEEFATAQGQLKKRLFSDVY